ncbi:hypothetical protein K1719_030784 [Acacia pycnantha]|nr:hypothetical protein K1719_030784 [Acacia pycnantha]
MFIDDDHSQCTPTSFGTLENKHKPLVFKDLRKIWEKRDPNLPWEKGYYHESNTLLLDDSPYKALLNPPHTSDLPLHIHSEDVVKAVKKRLQHKSSKVQLLSLTTDMQVL